jgi:hypothetical protein
MDSDDDFSLLNAAAAAAVIIIKRRRRRRQQQRRNLCAKTHLCSYVMMGLIQPFNCFFFFGYYFQDSLILVNFK